jgi:glucose/arabinose dehydrogenase
MRRRLPGLLTGLALLLAAGFAACRWLLPERFAVNAPVGSALFGWGGSPPTPEELDARIHVPSGYAISLYAAVPQARMLLPTPAGDLLVSVPREGKVVLLQRDADGDGAPDAIRTLLDRRDRPNGLALHGGWLYVAEAAGVVRVRFDAARGTVRRPVEAVVTGLPAGGNHWTRTIRFGDDGLLYLTLGSSCNVCIEKDPRRATMMRFHPDGSHAEIHATGLRNSVGFDWRPGTQELYATDNGRDLLGDDFPPDELNRIVPGGDYGWPVANGDRVLDPDLGRGHEERAAHSIPPAFAFRAHNAPLGMVFLRSPHQPPDDRGAALVALHGSWNRTHKDGYEVVSLHWMPDGRIVSRDFVWGFLRGEAVSGRPVDVAEAQDGTIFVSDDYAGAVYRIRWSGGAAPAAGP